MKTMPFHPVAELLPMMDGPAFSELVADIKANGLGEAIWTHEGKIIDGRNRYLACQECGVEPKFQEWSGDDLLAFIMSKNVYRRHLTPSQRAMVAARARKIYDEQAKDRQRASGGNHKKAVPVNLPEPAGDSRDLAGKALHVSGSYVDRATKVVEKGTPELIKAVDEGRMNVTTAAPGFVELPCWKCNTVILVPEHSAETPVCPQCEREIAESAFWELKSHLTNLRTGKEEFAAWTPLERR